MRVLFLLFSILTFSAKELVAQNNSLGLGTTNPHASAAFEIMDTAKGFLPPRMTTAQRNAISSPAQGLIVFNTTTKCLDVYTGNSWISYCDGACYPPPATPNAGPDQNVAAGAAVTLAGNNPSYGSGIWTIESGVGGNLGTPTSPTSTFSGLNGTSYTLKWTTTNPCGSSSDLVVINVLCPAGSANCNGSSVDGCEINTNTSAANCGACGNVCSIANGTAICVNGACALGSCNPGFADCDGKTFNGCEIDLRNSTNNCGSCGNVCSVPNANTVCVNGTCAIAACNAGFANCDGNTANGCETNLMTNVNSCGTCNNICNDNLSCTTETCVNGSCVSIINAGFCRISGQCFTNGQSNPSNPCQVCNSSVSQTSWSAAPNGTACPSGACNGGTCVTIP